MASTGSVHTHQDGDAAIQAASQRPQVSALWKPLSYIALAVFTASAVSVMTGDDSDASLASMLGAVALLVSRAWHTCWSALGGIAAVSWSLYRLYLSTSVLPAFTRRARGGATSSGTALSSSLFPLHFCCLVMVLPLITIPRVVPLYAPALLLARVNVVAAALQLRLTSRAALLEIFLWALWSELDAAFSGFTAMWQYRSAGGLAFDTLHAVRAAGWLLVVASPAMLFWVWRSSAAAAPESPSSSHKAVDNRGPQTPLAPAKLLGSLLLTVAVLEGITAMADPAASVMVPSTWSSIASSIRHEVGLCSQRCCLPTDPAADHGRETSHGLHDCEHVSFRLLSTVTPQSTQNLLLGVAAKELDGQVLPHSTGHRDVPPSRVGTGCSDGRCICDDSRETKESLTLLQLLLSTTPFGSCTLVDGMSGASAHDFLSMEPAEVAAVQRSFDNCFHDDQSSDDPEATQAARTAARDAVAGKVDPVDLGGFAENLPTAIISSKSESRSGAVGGGELGAVLASAAMVVLAILMWCISRKAPGHAPWLSKVPTNDDDPQLAQRGRRNRRARRGRRGVAAGEATAPLVVPRDTHFRPLSSGVVAQARGAVPKEGTPRTGITNASSVSVVDSVLAALDSRSSESEDEHSVGDSSAPSDPTGVLPETSGEADCYPKQTSTPGDSRPHSTAESPLSPTWMTATSSRRRRCEGRPPVAGTDPPVHALESDSRESMLAVDDAVGGGVHDVETKEPASAFRAELQTIPSVATKSSNDPPGLAGVPALSARRGHVGSEDPGSVVGGDPIWPMRAQGDPASTSEVSGASSAAFGVAPISGGRGLLAGIAPVIRFAGSTDTSEQADDLWGLQAGPEAVNVQPSRMRFANDREVEQAAITARKDAARHESSASQPHSSRPTSFVRPLVVGHDPGPMSGSANPLSPDSRGLGVDISTIAAVCTSPSGESAEAFPVGQLQTPAGHAGGAGQGWPSTMQGAWQRGSATDDTGFGLPPPMPAERDAPVPRRLGFPPPRRSESLVPGGRVGGKDGSGAPFGDAPGRHPRW